MTRVKGQGRGHRINLDLGPRALEQLAVVREATDASSQAATIRTAINTMATICAEMKDGGKLLIKKPDGTVVRVLVVIP